MKKSQTNFFLKTLFFISCLGTMLSAADCPRVQNKEKCMGECGVFEDANKNGVCDLWEKENPVLKKKNKGISENIKKQILTAPADIEKEQAKPQAVSQNRENQVKKTFQDRFLAFGLFWVVLANLLLILLSERLKCLCPAYIGFHRDLWNNILFISFFICALSGFFLYFKFSFLSRNILFKIHLYSGVLSFFASLYHFLERYSCMYPFKRKNESGRRACP